MASERYLQYLYDYLRNFLKIGLGEDDKKIPVLRPIKRDRKNVQLTNDIFVCIEEKHVITVFLVVELEQNCSSAPAEKLLRKLVFFYLFKI